MNDADKLRAAEKLAMRIRDLLNRAMRSGTDGEGERIIREAQAAEDELVALLTESDPDGSHF